MSVLLALNNEMLHNCFSTRDVKRLQEKLTVVPDDPFQTLPETMTLDWIADRIDDAEIMVTCWETPPLTNELIEKAPKLKAIFHSAGSIKSLIPQAVWDRNIVVANARHAIARGVAETMLGMIIAAGKMIIPLDRVTEKGGWRGSQWDEWVTEFYDITVGVVAASEVGKYLIEFLKPFQVDRIVYDPYASDELIESYGAKKVELNDLCQQSDIIAVAAPATEETRHMIGVEQFDLMKDKVKLINPSRGSVIDEKALCEALQKGKLYAVLDVTDPEPPAADSVLRTSPYCTLTPHIAGGIANARLRQGKLTVDEILNVVDGKAPNWQVRNADLHRMG